MYQYKELPRFRDNNEDREYDALYKQKGVHLMTKGEIKVFEFDTKAKCTSFYTSFSRIKKKLNLKVFKRLNTVTVEKL